MSKEFVYLYQTITNKTLTIKYFIMKRRKVTPNLKNLSKRAWNVKESDDYHGLTPFIQIFKVRGKFEMFLGNSYNHKETNLGIFNDANECLKSLRAIRKNKIYSFNGLA